MKLLENVGALEKTIIKTPCTVKKWTSITITFPVAIPFTWINEGWCLWKTATHISVYQYISNPLAYCCILEKGEHLDK